MDAAHKHPDADLVRRWQRGDAAAFEALVRRWEQPMGRFLYRLVGRGDQVQDLSQEVFLRVYLAKVRYREQGAFSTWIYRIALNVARDAGRRKRDLMPLPNHEPPDKGDPPETQCERLELEQVVAGALGELPDLQREVVVLRHYEGMNFEEMSRLLDIPPSTLKSRFAAGLVKLRIYLEQRGWASEEIES